MEKWKSPVYDHYEISVERVGNSKDGSRSKIRFKYTCRFDPINHPARFRDRKKTARGTTNLSSGMTCCLKRRNVNGDSQQTHSKTFTALFLLTRNPAIVP